MNKTATLLVSITVWLGEYRTQPVNLYGMRLNKIIPKERNYCTHVHSVLGTDIYGKTQAFNFYYN